MKKAVALLLTIILLHLCIPFSSAEETHEGFLLNLIKDSASEWTKTSTDRTFFAACAVMDAMYRTKGTSEETKITSIAKFAIQDDGIAFVTQDSLFGAVFCGQKQTLIVLYHPSSNTFNNLYYDLDSSELDTSLKLLILQATFTNSGGTFDKVDSSDFIVALSSVLSALES